MLTDKEAWQKALDNKGLVRRVLEKRCAFLERRDRAEVMTYRDHFQNGMVGLYIAALRFREDKRCKFSTYAEFWIYKLISRAHCNEGFKTVRVSVGAYERLNKLAKKHKENLPILMDEQSAQIRDAFKAVGGYIELDANVVYRDSKRSNQEGDISFVETDISITENKNDALKNFARQENKELIAEAFVFLKEIERTVISLRFGMSGMAERTTEQIARIVGLSRGMVRRIEKTAMMKLRQILSLGKIKKEEVLTEG